MMRRAAAHLLRLSTAILSAYSHPRPWGRVPSSSWLDIPRRSLDPFPISCGLLQRKRLSGVSGNGSLYIFSFEPSHQRMAQEER